MRVDDNGLHLRQSEINDWLLCPERFRRRMQEEYAAELLGMVPINMESDAALVGTAVHHAIETELDDMPHRVTELVEVASNYYTVMADKFENDPATQFTTHTFGTVDKALASVEHLINMWHQSSIRFELLYETDERLLTEWEFDVPFCEVDSLPVYLTGTADLVIPNSKIIDWKTAGQKYQRWEKQRWAVQPTVYTFAAHSAGYFDDMDRIPFDFWVLQRGGKQAQQVDCWRSVGHWEWLAEQITPMVAAIVEAANIMWQNPWQKNDQSALCSAKWCPFWSTCKGLHVPEGWDV